MDLKKIFNVGYQGFPDGSVSFYGTRIRDLTGYETEDFNSRRINWVKELVHPADLATAREAIKAGIKGDKTYSRAYRIRTKSGEEKWVLELSQIVCDAEGKFESVTGTLVDITDEKREEAAAERIRRLTGKYLLVALKGQQYGIPILKVKEIIRMAPVTPIPNLPGYVKGVLNLRGKVVPVIDLCLKFAMNGNGYTSRTCIVIVETGGGARNAGIGLVVDSVSEAVTIDGADIEDASECALNTDAQYILGMAKIEQTVKVLLDIDKLFSPEELESIQE